jgi:hypothetical protein
MDRREEDLRRREAELANLEEQVRTGTYQRQSEKNFPPYLHWWSWHPERDLPADALDLMKRLRMLFASLFIVYLINNVGALAVLFAPKKEGSDGFGGSAAVRIVLSIVFTFVLVPLSFELAFFPIYKALTRARAISFFAGMAVTVIWFAVLVFNLIGIPSSGSVGFIMMIDAFGINTAVGVIALLFCIAGVLVAVGFAFGFIALVKYYKQNGLVEKAKREGATMAVDYAKEHPDQALQLAQQLS